MFKETSNPYKFKYLMTGISGPGIEQVYLPPVPAREDILFRVEQKFVRPVMPDYLAKAVREMLYHRDLRTKAGEYISPDWIHPKYQEEINEWEQREWERSENGIWFWNKGVPTYITGFYYWYLSSWKTYFGYPSYRETDKELTYWFLFLEEDPDCYGGAFNTIRRYGKSVVLGGWAAFRTTRNFNHFCGMQGETDDKIKKFYNKFVKKPFYKLPYYHQPTYNTTTQQTNQIEFDIPPKRNKRYTSADEVISLESVVEYRESSPGAYDGEILHTYLMEEPGKQKKHSIYNEDGEGTWDIVVPCLSDGLQVIGKALLGTTVENLNISDKGGRAYKKLFEDSDYNNKQEDGRTKSGLYTAFLPGDCALKGFWDEWGHPMQEEAKQALLKRRRSFRNNPGKLAGLIRKYPLTIKEIFYVNTTGCEFNGIILQDRRDEIDMNPMPMYSRFKMVWENGKRFTKVKLQHDPDNGWFKASWVPKDPNKECNLVKTKETSGVYTYSPLNDAKYATGFDPIDHGVVVDNGVAAPEDGVSGGKRSKPVLLIKTKYDIVADGALSADELTLRAQPGKMVNGVWELDPEGKKYQYKSNLYFGMMDTRPYDPNVLYERVLMICWYFGVSLHVENQKPGVIRYFYANGCGDFILNKYVPLLDTGKKVIMEEGTPSSQTMIQEYTGAISTYVEYFGHMIPFREVIEDLLLFKPRKTTEHDYSVSMGFTELACLIKPKQKQQVLRDISEFMPMVDQWGNALN